jgi:hypothetical protein
VPKCNRIPAVQGDSHSCYVANSSFISHGESYWKSGPAHPQAFPAPLPHLSAFKFALLTRPLPLGAELVSLQHPWTMDHERWTMNAFRVLPLGFVFRVCLQGLPSGFFFRVVLSGFKKQEEVFSRISIRIFKSFLWFSVAFFFRSKKPLISHAWTFLHHFLLHSSDELVIHAFSLVSVLLKN